MLSNFFLNQSYTSMRGGGQRSLNIILENIYPVGSIHLTIGDYNPSEYFGGVWEKVSGGFLYGCVNNINNNITNTPGDKTYDTTLTIAQMPSHHHGETDIDNAIPKRRWEGSGSDKFMLSTQSYTSHSLYAIGKLIKIGGGQGHNHDIPHIGVWIWKRIS